MNSKIQKLYSKAIEATKRKHYEDTSLSQKQLDNFCATMFSELIIQECLSVLEDERELYEYGDEVYDHEYANRMDDKSDALNDAMGAIRNRFLKVNKYVDDSV